MKENFKDILGKRILIFDGAAGTMLQSRGLAAGEKPETWSIKRPDDIVALHSEYIAAGADIIKTNSFGANALRFPDGGEYSVEQLVSAAVACAREAADAASKQVFVALDIGPLGKLIGDGEEMMDFEDAVSTFARTVNAGKSGADLVLLETFGDITETRAALIAVKENCDLPVVVTNVYGADGRLFTGSDAAVACTVLSGLGADAIGMNCSLGPRDMLGIIPDIAASTALPIAVNPNAGLPRTDAEGNTVYDVSAEEFADAMLKMAQSGASLLGGCCGTTPEYIARLAEKVRGLSVIERKVEKRSIVTSATRICEIGNERLTIIGERINPTGKPKFKDALRRGDIDYAVNEAHNEAAAGADILDVNVGLPEIDECAVLTEAVCRIQSVCDLPLQIDTALPTAMEAALRRYNGKALINSVNGSEASMSAILPLAAKYGGMIVALTLDESGIPDSAEGRYEIAKRIVERAAEYGIPKEDVLVDPLTLTLGADPLAAEKTLGAVKLIKENLGVATSLGVSNISFGLPDRDKVNTDFLTAAMEAGLSAAILNPNSASMMQVARGEGDMGGDALGRLGEHISAATVVKPRGDDLTGAIYGGMKSRAVALAIEECDKISPKSVIDEKIVPALEEAGKEFEAGKIFLPGLLACADAAVAALDVVSERILSAGGERVNAGKVVMATVEGDVHDIGKNIVCVMLKSYGFEVIDLGRDVCADTVVAAAQESGASVVGLSALMTTTVPAMEKTIKALREKLPEVKVVVGGAVLTEEYSARIGADKYAPDAMATVRYATEVYQKN